MSTRPVHLNYTAGICAFDLDECTATVAFDTEQGLRAFMEQLEPRNRVRLVDDAEDRALLSPASLQREAAIGGGAFLAEMT